MEDREKTFLNCKLLFPWSMNTSVRSRGPTMHCGLQSEWRGVNLSKNVPTLLVHNPDDSYDWLSKGGA